MPKTNQNNNHKRQSPEDLSDDSVDDILSSVDQFIENVYRNLDMTPPHDASSGNSAQFQTRRSPNTSISPPISPVGAASLSLSSPDDNRDNVVSPSRRLDIDVEVERINLMCDRVERNLRSIGVFINNSGSRSSSEDRLSRNILNSPTSSTTSMSVLNLDNSPSHGTPSSRFSGARETVTIEMPRPIIDLSESQIDTPLYLGNTDNNNDEEDDDDVILVSSNIQPIVDLCTPGDQREPSRRRRRQTGNYATLNRRRLSITDPNNEEICREDGPSAARKRRLGSKRRSLDLSTTKNVEIISSEVNVSSDRSPYTCAVCLESYFQRQPTTTRCGHVFCQACISEAIRLTHKCPMCNAKVGRNQIHRLYL